MLQHAVAAFLSAAVLAPFSYYAGQFSNLLKLPQITGYLVSGIICGPYVLGILSKTALQDLNIIEGACLGIIGFAAGAELHLQDLQNAQRQVVSITLFISLLSWAFSYMAFMWLNIQSLLPSMDASHLIAIASLGSTLMIARSPASAIAVLKEVEGRGPFSSLVLAVTVVKDVIVIVAFAINLEFVRSITLPSRGAGVHSGLQLSAVLLPIVNVAASCMLGVVGSLLMGMAMKSQPPPLSVNPPAGQSQLRFRLAGLVVSITAVFQLAHGCGADGLLACLTMGLLAANRKHERAERDREELHSMLATVMRHSNVAFFGLAGASLKLSALSDTLGAALVLYVVRLIAIWCGASGGCYVGRTTLETRKIFWMSMVTQAGVAMGLARIVATRFPDWGPHFQTLMVSVIILNMFTGPPLFRTALLRVGEANIPPSTSSLFPGEGDSSSKGDNAHHTVRMVQMEQLLSKDQLLNKV